MPAEAHATAAHVCTFFFEFIGESRVPVATLRLLEAILQQVDLYVRDTRLLNWHVHISGYDHGGKVFWVPVHEDPDVLTSPVRSVLSSVYNCVESPASLMAVNQAVLGIGQHASALRSGTQQGSFTSGPGAAAGVLGRAAAGVSFRRSVSVLAEAGVGLPATAGAWRPAAAGSIQSETRGRQPPLVGRERSDGLEAGEALSPMTRSTPARGSGHDGDADRSPAADDSPPRDVDAIPRDEDSAPNESGDHPAAENVMPPVDGLPPEVPVFPPTDVDNSSTGEEAPRPAEGRVGRAKLDPRQPTCPVSEHAPPILPPSINVLSVARALLSSEGRLSHLRTALSKVCDAIYKGAYARRARITLSWWPRPPDGITMWPYPVSR